MTQHLDNGQLRPALASLFELSALRESQQHHIREEYAVRTNAARRSFEQVQSSSNERVNRQRQELEAAYDAAQRAAAAAFRRDHAALLHCHDQHRKELTSEFVERQRDAEARLTHETWEATTVFDARQPALAEQLAQVRARVAAQSSALAGITQNAAEYLIACRQQRLLVGDGAEHPVPPPLGEPFEQLAKIVESARAESESLRSLALPRFFIGHRPWLVLPPLLLVTGALAVWLMGEPLWRPLVGATALSLIAWIGAVYWLFQVAGRQAVAIYDRLRQLGAEGQSLKEGCLAQSQSYFESQRQRSVAKRDRELQAARERFSRITAELVERRDASLEQLEQARAEQQIELTRRRDAELAVAHEKYPALLEQSEAQHQQEQESATEALDHALAAAATQRNARSEQLAERWHSGMQQAYAVVRGAIEDSNRIFPAWVAAEWESWSPPVQTPPAVRFGEFHVELPAPQAAESLPDTFSPMFNLPALLPFPNNASLLIKAAGDGKQAAVNALQAVMLRLLSTIPPGKLKFTIIDPVGLGENFAGFMHLADYDESLVGSRIWTEPAHIEQRLADLTEQMETVIQKYLRNDFRSIDEYNAFAGEVAEAFRVLVVANFPANFTEAAAKRLSSIVSSGARCGVFTLMTTDTKQPLPAKFDLADIERNSTVVNWSAGRFVWKDADFGRYPLSLDSPPPEDRFSQIVHNVGESTTNLRRVEVPFEYIAPPRESWWTGDASGGIDVALGRIGASKRQHLRLGRGTAQHVLIAGKTGSGKSTLLHALITNLSLVYSPREVELYLVDFKKGVEFKTYATHELPHARVIAVESEREFGLSVLQRLDAELKQRGDRFRSLGVQDLAGFRSADPGTRMPRVLLIIDEFQELFVEDDRLAQESALLLDRLVRQGRAFGIHVLLGSQTLGGAYTLARSTIGQMAVRIALQCSEADAHLILSDDNSAARLLGRPGEAIYNDANGLVEGNSPFQVVWLPEERREQYLDEIQAMHRAAAVDRPRPIVFDGHQAADLRGNALLQDRLRMPDAALPTQAHVWLGDAVAIKDPTAAVLRRQGGSNLLVVGQQEESARGMFASALVSLAAQHPSPDGQRSGAQFYVLESVRDGGQDRQLRHLTAILPQTSHVVGRRDEGSLMAELAAEVARRHEDDQRGAPPIYLLIFDLARFRDLRRSDDDLGFSFGSESRPPSPARLFGTILRDGPEVGVHTLTWCDSAASLQRVFDRQALREFDLRVLFQMSAGDSSQLIDSPAAGKLGAHYALLHDEEAGRLEKFRPYGWPDAKWLSAVAEQLKSAPGKGAPDPLAK
jgi:hypothetical protein